MESFALSLPSFSPPISKIWQVKSFHKTFQFDFPILSQNTHKSGLSCAKSDRKSSSGVTTCSFRGSALSSVQIYQKNADSIVKIFSHCKRDKLSKETGKTESVESVECASGIVWDQKGHIITNYHIIHGICDLRIIIQDAIASEAEVVAHDIQSNVAILHVKDGEKLKPIQRGTSENLWVGQEVYSIAYPLELQKTFSDGIISGLHRYATKSIDKADFAFHNNMIQTYATSNMGNSGGALLDSSGCLIGMNTSLYTDGGYACGIGFAIPIDQLADNVEALLDAVKFGK